MPPIIEFAEKFGWIVAMVVWITYEVVTKLWPQSQAAKLKREEAERSELVRLTDRLIDCQAQSTGAIAANTKAVERMYGEFDAHLGAMTRALDDNTRVLARFLNRADDKRKPGD